MLQGHPLLNLLSNSKFFLKESLAKQIAKLFDSIKLKQIATQHGFNLWIARRDKSRQAKQLTTLGSCEPYTSEFIKHIIKPGDFTIDVGANIGYHSALMAGGGANVWAFEPGHDNFKLLEKNLQNSSNVVLMRAALGAYDGSAKLWLNRDCPVDHRIQEPSANRPTIPITLLRLDSFQWPEQIKLLKIDVQGAEDEVLKGGIQTLKKVENLIIEWNPPRSKILDYLKNFKLHWINEENENLEPFVPRLYNVETCRNILARRKI